MLSWFVSQMTTWTVRLLFLKKWPSYDTDGNPIPYTELPDFANTYLESDPARVNENALTLADSSLSAYFFWQSRSAPVSPHILFGDVWPRNAQGEPEVYVPDSINARYHNRDENDEEQDGGYGYLVQEIFDSLTVSPGFDIGDYDYNQDGQLDQLFMVIRNDSRLGCNQCGWSSLRGLHGLNGVPKPILRYWSPSRQDSIRVDWSRSGSQSFIGDWSARRALLIHEYGHDFFDMGHTRMIDSNEMPYDVPPEGETGHNACGYNRMCGGGGGSGPSASDNYDPAAASLSGYEIRRAGWAQRTILNPGAGNQTGLSLTPLYNNGTIALIPLRSGSAGDTLSLENRQGNNFFDEAGTFTIDDPFYGTSFTGIGSTGLLATLSSGLPSGSYNGYRYDIMPPDNEFSLQSRCTGYRPGCAGADVFLGDMHEPDIATQLSPWTRPNVSGYTFYDEAPVGFEPNWFAVTNITYDSGGGSSSSKSGNPDSTLYFDFDADVRDGFTITEDSWMGGETSGTTFTGAITVSDGAVLTLERDTDLSFAAGLYVDAGSALVVEEGAVLRFAPGEGLYAYGVLETTGTDTSPVSFLPLDPDSSWAGVRLGSAAYYAPPTLTNSLHYAHIEGAALGLDIRTDQAYLDQVTLTGNVTGIRSDFNEWCIGDVCYVERSRFTLVNSIVQDNTGVGIHARHTDAAIVNTSIYNNGSHGLLVSDADVFPFAFNTASSNGSPSTLTAGLAVISGGDLTLGNGLLPGQQGAIDDRSGYNTVVDNEPHETGVTTGGALLIGNPADGGDNSIYKTNGPGSGAFYVGNDTGTSPVYIVEAEYTWWGSSSGPPTGAFYGSVDAGPYLTAPPCGPQCRVGDGGQGGKRLASAEQASEERKLQGYSARMGDLSTSPEDESQWLGQEIRRERLALAGRPDDPEAPSRVLRLAHLQRLDREDALGEQGPTWTLLRTLRAGLQAPGPHRPAASAALRVEVQEAVRSGEYDEARALLVEHGTAEIGDRDQLALDLAEVVLYEQTGEYAEALSALRAVQAGLPEDDLLLGESLAMEAAVLEERLAEAGMFPEARTGTLASASTEELPTAYKLGLGYPNPSRGTVTLPLALPAASDVRVELYDLLGRRVAVVSEGRREAGQHRMVLEGDGLASGIYVVRAVVEPTGGAETRTFTQRLTLIR